MSEHHDPSRDASRSSEARADRHPPPDTEQDFDEAPEERDPEAGQHLIWVLLAAATMLLVLWW